MLNVVMPHAILNAECHKKPIMLNVVILSVVALFLLVLNVYTSVKLTHNAA
jgi:hypothetical protein